MPITRARFPHPLVLLVGCIALAAVLTHLLPAGEYERREDAATGRMAVVAGTYHAVAPSPVGVWGAVRSVQLGIVAAASVVAFVFLVGGAFSVVEETGALSRAVDWLTRRLRDRGALVIPASSLFFAAGGITFGMGEEIVAFIPVLLLLVRRLGFDSLTAVAMSYGAAAVGAAMSPVNPFGVGIAQTIAGVPLLSGAWFRIAFFVPGIALWIAWTMRYAARHRTAPLGAATAIAARPEEPESVRPAGRTAPVLLLVALAFATLIYGVLRLEWGIDELAALFFGMGILAGVVGGLGMRGTAEAYVRGFGNLAFAALLIGFARAILVVLEQGRIIDSIVAGLFAPLGALPVTVAALAMLAVQGLIHLPVPSTSGQAMITLPILVPLSDLLGLPRQVTVLAYQYGAGLLENVVPTNGALLAMLALCDVPFDKWIRFAAGITALLLALAAVAIAVAVATGLR